MNKLTYYDIKLFKLRIQKFKELNSGIKKFDHERKVKSFYDKLKKERTILMLFPFRLC